jgi:hypothetical protein
MKGIEILQKKCKELNIEFDYDYSPKGEINGNVKFKLNNGFDVNTTIKRLSEIFGNLSFFHFTPEEAIDEMLNILINEVQHT